MLNLERIGQRSAYAMAAGLLVVIGFLAHDWITPRDACGQSLDTLCWHVMVPFSDATDRLIARLHAAGFSDKEIADYISGISAPLRKSP